MGIIKKSEATRLSSPTGQAGKTILVKFAI
jgi:hypothetical protein